jgi:hypothetical protein
MRTWKPLLLAAMLGAASLNALACYTVYDRSSRVVYNGEAPPVDMSLPLHDALAARFPGGHMVFDTQTDCPSIAAAPIARLARNGTPMLTNVRTAQAMGARYTPLPGGIALVQPGTVTMRPGVTVVPAEAVAANERVNERVVVGELSRY